MSEPRLTKILYVEDDADIAEMTMMTLEHFGGFTVTHCKNGREALSSYPELAPQLILMDVMMPGMDGTETYSRLKANTSAPLAPIIFMTAKAQVHEQAAYINLGAIGVIVKPFDPVTLSDEILELWQNSIETV